MRIFYGIQFIAGYKRNGAFVRLRHRAHGRFRSRAQLFRQKFIYAQIGGKIKRKQQSYHYCSPNDNEYPCRKAVFDCGSYHEHGDNRRIVPRLV